MARVRSPLSCWRRHVMARAGSVRWGARGRGRWPVPPSSGAAECKQPTRRHYCLLSRRQAVLSVSSCILGVSHK